MRYPPLSLLLALTLTACGGGGSEAAEPANEPAPAEEAAGEDLVPPIPPDSMVAQMLMQRTLDHPEVHQYLHTEVEANLPLTVHAVASLAGGADGLTAGGQPVRAVAEPAARVRFTAREDLDGPRARVRFEIPDEGVVGHVDLELAGNVWRAVDAEVVEH